MGLHIDWRYLDGALFDDLTEYFEKFELAVTMNAEEGSVGASTVTLYDPNAELDIVGLSHLRVYEMDAPAGQQCIGQYHVADGRVHRGDSERVTVQRVWDINLVDINALLARRVFSQGLAERPAETDIARIQWLMTTGDFRIGNFVTDSRYFNTAGPVAMDAVDYRGQTPFSVLDDCAQQSGKNFYLWYAEDVDAYGLWYDFAISSNYSSDILLSNVLADVDYSTTFAISQDTELKRDPSRVYAGVYLPYDGGAVYASSASTLVDYPLRDFVAPSVNVKTRAKALARARRYLNDLNTEEDVITTTVIVPRAQVNDLMQGMRVQVKASHLPGYSDYVWMRCVNRTVKEYNEDEYAITVELMAPKAPTVYPSAYAILHRSAGPFDGNVVWWDSNGDNPDPGFAGAPTGAGLSIWEPVNPVPDRPYRGILVTGTGTIDVTFHASVVGVLIDNIVFSITWAIRKNGVVVASQAQNVSGFLQYLWVEQTVTIAGLEVEPDDEIDATIVCIPPTLPFFKTPGGAGQAGERLEVTGGTLV